MTIASQTSRNDYTAAGGTTFQYTFKVFSDTHLKVYNAGVLQALNTDYTVTGVGTDAGGNVVFTVAPTNGNAVAIIRNAPYTQLTYYVENDPFPAETHEAALDRLTQQTQQLLEKLARAAALADSSALTSIVLPDPVTGGELIRWKTDKTNLELVASGSLAAGILSPIVAMGDLVQGGAGAIPERLAVGTPGQIVRVGTNKWEAGQLPLILTNKTGSTINAGEVVAIDSGNDAAVALGDTVSSFKRFTVAGGSVANNAAGWFVSPDQIVTGVLAQGAIARGEYVRKSATSKKVETTGVAQGDAVGLPSDAIGLALTAASGGAITLLWWGYPPTVGGASATVYTGIATPATPASGSIGLYAPSAPSGLRRLRLIDAGAQLIDLAGVIFRGNGNPFKDVNTTAAETSIFASAPTIKGGTLGTDRVLRFTILGDILNVTGGGAGATLKVKYGATTVLNVSNAANFFSVESNAARGLWHARGEIAAAGATGAQVAALRFAVFAKSNQGVSGVAVVEGDSGAGSSAHTSAAFHNAVAEDSTADKVFDVTIQPTSSSANLSIRVFAILLEVL